MNLILFDDHNRDKLLPFTFTRPLADIRVGIFTVAEKWKIHFSAQTSFLTQPYLSAKFKPGYKEDENIYVAGSVLPTNEFKSQVESLAPETALISQGNIVAVKTNKKFLLNDLLSGTTDFGKNDYNGNLVLIERPWDIFGKAGDQIKFDFNVFKGENTSIISSTNQVKCPENVFIEVGAKVEFSILNAEAGPIYIGKNTEVMEGCLIRGPFALCEGATLKMGAKIYGPTVIGPHSKVGGEVNNSVIFGYSNKAHDGFLGNSVLGEWCNLGADTNNSNLKNNYGEVKVYSYFEKNEVKTGLQFCGLMMGDHSKAGINTMFNTGTVVGVSSNIFGSGFPQKHIPSFNWGGKEGWENFKLDKAIELAGNVYARRGLAFDSIEKDIFHHLYNL